MEIERKYLIDKFPDGLPLLEECTMYQGYVSVEPAVRIRKKVYDGGVSYKMTIKSAGELAREEIEFPITKKVFEELKRVFCPVMIEKIKKNYSLPGGLTLECSLVDKDTEFRFMYAEVEFKTTEEAESFAAPAFLGKEITYDNSYKMNNYWAKRLGKNQ